MSKKWLTIILAGVVIVAGCLVLLVSNASKLPPDVALPSSKPASARPADKTALSVRSEPVGQAVVVTPDSKATKVEAAKAATSVVPAANCDQPTAGNPTQAANSPIAVSSVLDSVIKAVPLTGKLSL